MNLGRISVSQASMAAKCMASHYFRYGLEIRARPNGAMIVGSSVDKGAKAFLDSRIMRESELNVTQVCDKYVEELEERWLGVGHPVYFESLDKAKDRGVKAIPELYTKSLLHSDPIATQQETPLELSPDLNFIGYIDMLEEEVFVDYKATSKKKSKGWELNELQAPAYGGWALLNVANGNPTFLARYDILIFKKMPELQRLEVVIDARRANYVYQWLRDMNRFIKAAYANEVWPCNRQAMTCSRKWCGYWKKCEEVYGGTVKD